MAVETKLKSAKCKHSAVNCEDNLHRGIFTRGKVMSRGNYKCKECEKHFGNHPDLKLHIRAHQGNTESACDKDERDAQVSDVLLRYPVTAMTPPVPSGTEAQLSPLVSAKKVTGLTKVRLEDCLRCDACSCIYLDEADYHKHMRNFHQKTPKKPKGGHGKKCRSCCKNCKCSTTSSRQTCITQLSDACRLPFDIKDRWKKLMNFAEKKIDNTDFPVKIKLEPDDTYDYSHLLSQVEVSIKTEPDC